MFSYESLLWTLNRLSLWQSEHRQTSYLTGLIELCRCWWHLKGTKRSIAHPNTSRCVGFDFTNWASSANHWWSPSFVMMISVLRLAQAAIVIFYTTWWTKVLPFAFISARTTRLSNNWWKWMAHCVQSEHLILEDDMSCNGKQHFSSVFPCNLQISKNNACLCCQTRESRTWMVMNRKDQERHVHTWFDQPMQDSSTQM